MLICALGFCPLALSIPAKANNGSVAAVRLIQTHTYWGDTETIVSLHGLRVNNRGRMGYCLVAKEPDWAITIFREDDKVYIKQSLRHIQSTGILSNFILNQQDRYLLPTLKPRSELLRGTAVNTISTSRSKSSYLPLKHIAAPQVESILYILYKVPTNGGIPVGFWKASKGIDWMTGLDNRGTVRSFLSTRKIEHISVSRKVFDPPSGYTKGKSVQEVLLSKSSRDASADVDDLFESSKPKRR